MTAARIEASEPGRIYPLCQLLGAGIHASDGSIGAVEDLLVDDAQWTVRYLVADTGGWLAGRLVLVSPAHLRRFDWALAAGELSVDLTRAQVESSPPLESLPSMGRRFEETFNAHYGLAPYWIGPELWGPAPDPAGLLAASPFPRETTAKEDRHLRSGRELFGCVARAPDGDVGVLRDVLVDDVAWAIRFVQVELTGPASDEGTVLVPADAIDAMDWTERTLRLRLTRARVASAPPFAGHASPGENVG